jgi:hypothetical protein
VLDAEHAGRVAQVTPALANGGAGAGPGAKSGVSGSNTVVVDSVGTS